MDGGRQLGFALVQRIGPPSDSERFEGVAFSPGGSVLAIATADTNAILLFRRAQDGQFEERPYSSICGTASKLSYPHDVSFSPFGNRDLLAVAQRTGAIAVFRRNWENDAYGEEPILEIKGEHSKLSCSDGVAFAPPNYDYLAACNLASSTISFYRRTSLYPLQFAQRPEFELTHPAMFRPDGLAFSQCGRWLATANHGANSVTVFERRNRLFCRGKLRYGPEPVSTIKDDKLRYPHSVAFTPRAGHLIVTNAGGNYFTVYEPTSGLIRRRWSDRHSLKQPVGNEECFRLVNSTNQMEGGPKGVATSGNELALCSPEFGIEIYAYDGR